MGTHVIKVPDIGEGIAEVELVLWHVGVGDAVREDQGLADVMTDKANVEIPSPVAGTVLALGGKPGDVLAVGSELIRIEVGAADDDRASQASAPRAATAPAIETPQATREAVAAEAETVEPTPPPEAVAPGANAAHASQSTRETAAMGSGARPSARVSAGKPHIPASAVKRKERETDGSRGADWSREADASREADGSSDAEGSRDADGRIAHDSRAADGNRAAQPAPRRADDGDKPLASPAVRRHARELGIALEEVAGTGERGRITHEDLERNAAGQAGDANGRSQGSGDARGGAAGQGRAGAHRGDSVDAGAPAVTPDRDAPATARSPDAVHATTARDDEESIPVIGLRRKIAQRMQEAKRRIPHFTYVEEVDVTELEALRAALNAKWAASRGKLTMLPFLVRAIAHAVPDFPQVNARFQDDDEGGGGTLTRFRVVHAGIATQTDGGLVVPVLRNAQARDLWSAAAEIARLAEAARAGRSTREELTGSTITITSLGALGGIVTTPVINYPEVAIVGVNRIVERPMIRAGAIVPRLVMNLSASFDHRVVDGMDAARFVQALRSDLETPATLFID